MSDASPLPSPPRRNWLPAAGFSDTEIHLEIRRIARGKSSRDAAQPGVGKTSRPYTFAGSERRSGPLCCKRGRTIDRVDYLNHLPVPGRVRIFPGLVGTRSGEGPIGDGRSISHSRRAGLPAFHCWSRGNHSPRSRRTWTDAPPGRTRIDVAALPTNPGAVIENWRLRSRRSGPHA